MIDGSSSLSEDERLAQTRLNSKLFHANDRLYADLLHEVHEFFEVYKTEVENLQHKIGDLLEKTKKKSGTQVQQLIRDLEATLSRDVFVYTVDNLRKCVSQAISLSPELVRLLKAADEKICAVASGPKVEPRHKGNRRFEYQFEEQPDPKAQALALKQARHQTTHSTLPITMWFCPNCSAQNSNLDLSCSLCGFSTR